MTRPSTTTLLWAGAALSLGAVAAAVFSQEVFDTRPCPWCILQRVMFLVIAALCAAAALARPRAARLSLAGLGVVMAGLGIAVAIYQHAVAAKSASCNLTLADRIIEGLNLEALSPTLFRVTASCADAAVTVLGVPIEFLSLSLFAVLGAGGAVLLLRKD